MSWPTLTEAMALPVKPTLATPTKEKGPRMPEVFCGCGTSILFGSLATEADRLSPTCSECEAGIAALARLGGKLMNPPCAR